VLPLVEFFLEDGMTDEEAVHILDMSVPKKKKERSWKENRMSSILPCHTDSEQMK
jgi:intraflagellar transport protein 122